MRKISFKQEIIILCLLLIVGHIYQYFQSGFNLNCLIRVITCLLCGLTVFIFDKKYFYLTLYITGLFIMATDRFNNYSIFWIVYIFIRNFPKQKYLALILYLVDIFIVCEFHDKSPSHLFIHILTCIFFFIISEDSTQPVTQELALTDEERNILSQLENENRTIDNIYGYSKSTVLRKLENACIRNNCENNTELRKIYRNNTKLTPK